jgi:hypothetical protein
MSGYNSYPSDWSSKQASIRAISGTEASKIIEAPKPPTIKATKYPTIEGTKYQMDQVSCSDQRHRSEQSEKNEQHIVKASSIAASSRVNSQDNTYPSI